jgi:hypothetical protein
MTNNRMQLVGISRAAAGTNSRDHLEPSTYFGIWSESDIGQVSGLLRSLGARFEQVQERLTEDVLREWCAWDRSAGDPYVGYHLWIHSDDLAKVGDHIIERFPERKFDDHL